MNWMFRCYNPFNMQSHFLQFDRNLSPENGRQDLKKRFAIIGLTTQFHKSICLILIHLTGEVPVDCDCASKRRLLLNDHGVTHHGASFQTSKSQRLAISNLTKVDQTIFKHAEELFKENVKRTEEEYSVRLCDKTQKTQKEINLGMRKNPKKTEKPKTNNDTMKLEDKTRIYRERLNSNPSISKKPEKSDQKKGKIIVQDGEPIQSVDNFLIHIPKAAGASARNEIISQLSSMPSRNDRTRIIC